MDWKRVLQVVVCLILVCALLVDVSPIKAEAFAGYVVGGTLAAGALIALILAASGGAVYVPTAETTYTGMGSGLLDYMYQWGSTAEQLEENEAFWSGLSLVGNDPDDDGDDDADRVVRIPDWLKRGVAAFTAAAILGECLLIEQKEVPATTGWSYYGDLYLPTLPSFDGYPYVTISSYGTSEYYIFFTPDPLFDYSYGGSFAYIHLNDFTFYQIRVTKSKLSSWDLLSSYSVVGPNDWYGKTGHGRSLICLWSNYDILSYKDGSTVVYPAGSEPCTSFIEEVQVQPNSFVNDTKQQLVDQIISANDLVVPDITYANIIGSDGSVLTGITELLRRLDEGIITHEEFMEIITAPAVEPEPEPDPDPEPSQAPEEDMTVATEVGSPDVDTDVGEDTLANTNAATFLDNLANVITTPFKWIWGKIETFFTPLLKPELWLDPLPDIAIEPAKWIWDNIETFFEPLLSPDALKAPFEWIWEKIEPIPDQVTEAVTDAVTAAGEKVENAVKSLVVPDEDYLSDKVDSLRSEFAFADSIVRTGQALHVGLAGVTTEPPVIYIELGASRGSYNLGGTVPFLDLRWYAEYKPTVDTIISAFLWICFVWRVLIKLPGIIEGMPGDFNVYSALDLGLTSYLPQRSAMLERTRVSLREEIRKKE